MPCKQPAAAGSRNQMFSLSNDPTSSCGLTRTHAGRTIVWGSGAPGPKEGIDVLIAGEARGRFRRDARQRGRHRCGGCTIRWRCAADSAAGVCGSSQHSGGCDRSTSSAGKQSGGLRPALQSIGSTARATRNAAWRKVALRVPAHTKSRGTGAGPTTRRAHKAHSCAIRILITGRIDPGAAGHPIAITVTGPGRHRARATLTVTHRGWRASLKLRT
jgi:hypothetical protein